MPSRLIWQAPGYIWVGHGGMGLNATLAHPSLALFPFSASWLPGTVSLAPLCPSAMVLPRDLLNMDWNLIKL